MKQGFPTPILCFPILNEDFNIPWHSTIIHPVVKKILFAGNNQIAVDILKFLKSQHAEIVGLLVHPKSFSKKRQSLVLVSKLAKNRIFQGDQLQESSVVEAIRALKPDLLLSINFRYLFKPQVISIPRFGCINLHFGYLPYNRGVFADAWSIIEDTPAGVTYHLIDPGVDTGKIVAQRLVLKEPTDTGKTLYKRLTRTASDLFVQMWPSLQAWSFTPRPQPKGETSHRRSDIKSIDHINLEKSYKAKDLINILRARTFPPFHGAHFTTEDGRTIYLRLSLYERNN